MTSVTDTYVSFFLQKPLWDVWTLFLLGMARIVPMIALAPFLGGKVLPDSLKLGFGVALTTIFFPQLLASSTSGTILVDMHFIFLMLKEVIVGGILGFLASAPFFLATDAGTLIDHQRGSQSLQVTDPTTQVQASPFGLLYNNLLVALFFGIGGPFIFFEAIHTSYVMIPADQFFNPEFFTMSNPVWPFVIKMVNMMLTISLQLAAPALIALLMSDLFLGIANRMAPQVQISFLLWSLKAYVGIGILWAGWWLIFRQLENQSLNWLKMIQSIVERL